MTHHNGCLRVLRELSVDNHISLNRLASKSNMSETATSARFRQLRCAPYNCVMICEKGGPYWWYAVGHIPAKTRRMMGEPCK